MDKIYLEKLEVVTIIGTLPEERHTPRSLFLDVELGLDLEPAGRADDLYLSVDYAQLSNDIRQLGLESSFLLLEAFGARTLDICLANPLVRQARVKINKPGAVSGTGALGIEMFREQNPA